ncbi:hypothetical protein G6F57_006735 [Rhizopus arrhizus]|uniref:START domain-containing protein n=1 Tax=Rhizopus oryzae TaxID=64495 RepID=A0A9P7BSI9_RHIOR|nr:hypothetical protein G6F23_006482 [Rhizopus arrhizus]KAG0811256.1 hypothetical protein G6F20_007302 [Rhizopus arrhizus]KAG0895958.1 hypothetical protein G6F34_007778 [Rhizopus arrhizus]KAG0909664.1 hypothetical protein G6F33_008582 [Rhizopus arrhizus]KAG0946192.1 hypothetical protein G6F32_006676 [Rhizopus arrhizus]
MYNRKHDDPSFLRVAKSNYYDRDSGIATTETEDEGAAPTCIFSDDDEFYKRTERMPSMTAVFHSQGYLANLADQTILSLKDFIQDKDWKKVLKHKSGTTVYMLQKQNKGEKSALFRGEAVIEGFTPQSIFYVIGMRKLWDEQFEEGKLIENLNDSTSLTYESYKSTSTSKAYDVTLVEKIDCLANGEIIFACTSVDTPKVPKVSGKNRHQIKLQGWVLKQISKYPVATKVTYVTQESIKGWIPGLTKKSLARKPLVIAAIDGYLQRKADRLKVQGQSTINQQHISDLSIPKHATHTQTSQSTLTLSVPSPQISSEYLQSSPTLGKVTLPPLFKGHRRPSEHVVLSNPPPRISSLSSSTPKQVKFADNIFQSNNSIVKTEPMQPTHKVSNNPIRPRLYPASPHRSSRKRSLEILKDYVESNLDGWKQIGDESDIKMYIKTIPDSVLPIMRSYYEFSDKWTVEQICSVIQCFGARKIWDEYFEDGQVIERYSQKEYLIHIKMKSLFPIQSRDFSILTSIESNISTGAVYIASTSVEDGLIPPPLEKDQHTRGTYSAYGWALVPTSTSVQVTFIAHMHLGGKTPLPSSIIRRLTTQVPSCLEKVKQYLENVGCPPYIRRVAGKITVEHFDTENKLYSMTYIAKHAPSRQSHSSWCTDLRIHASVYPLGYHVETQPQENVRVAIKPGVGLRIYTESDILEGKHIHITVSPVLQGSEAQYTCSSTEDPQTKMVKEEQEQVFPLEKEAPQEIEEVVHIEQDKKPYNEKNL